jgi:hypothetical protein
VRILRQDASETTLTVLVFVPDSYRRMFKTVQLYGRV